MTSAGLVARRRATEAVFWCTTLAAAAPLLATKYLPFTDLPEHVAAIATLDRLLFGGGDGSYTLALGQSQYLLYDVVGAVVTRVVGDAVVGNRLLLLAVAILWPVSLRSLLRALGRDERAAILAPMVFWNRALVLGFLPFIGSVPLLLFGLAAVARLLREPRKRSAALLALLALVLFYTHVSAWTTFLAMAVVLVVVGAGSLRSPRAAAVLLAPLLPSVFAAVAWWRSGSLTSPDGSAEVHRMGLVEKLGAMTVWNFDVWKTHVDELCSIVWWGAFALLVVRGGGGAGTRRAAPEEALAERAPAALPHAELRAAALPAIPLCVALVMYLVTPFGVGTAAYLDVRLAPLIALSALLTLRPQENGWGRGPLAAATCATVLYAGNACYEIRRVAAETLGDLDALLAVIPPGARLVSLNFEARTPRVHYFPYIYAGSYHRVRAEAIASYSFSEMAHWPIHYAEGRRPPTSLYSLSPCNYRYRRDGAYFDYVLVQGAADPFAGVEVGPRFAPRAATGRFTLYAKSGVEPAAAAALPDRATCAPPGAGADASL